MNAELMTQYVRFVADNLLQALGVPKVYNVGCPFEWMDQISLQGKSNFFETRVTEYAKANIHVNGSQNDASKNVFSLEEDF